MNHRLAIAVCLLTTTAVYAADPKPAEKKPDNKHGITFIEPERAGVDYALQGEYQGTAGAAKWGAQVIAMGDGKFHAVFEPGGLPGAGWDGKTRYESEGQLDGDKVTLMPIEKVAWGDGHLAPPLDIKKGFDAVISGAGVAITGKTDSGDAFTLTKIVRHSSTEGAKPPQGAIVLFDGSNVDAWKGTKIIDEGWLKGTMKEGGTTKQNFTDFTLHVEFLLPFKPFARGQERGNSGVYTQNRYETQVLDSFGLKGMDNECGGVYTKSPPSVNMCYPPLTWQTYDIDFVAARYENGMKKSDAVITTKFNGALIQDHFKINGPTGGGKKEDPKDDVQNGPIYLQSHGPNPVFYRNVWIVENK